MLNLLSKIYFILYAIYRYILHLIQLLKFNSTWSILSRITLILLLVFTFSIEYIKKYESVNIIKKYNLDYIPPKPKPIGVPQYIQATREQMQKPNNIPHYLDIFIILSQLHNTYVILTSIEYNKNKLILNLSSKIQEGFHTYVNTMQNKLPKHMHVDKITFNNLKVKVKQKKKKKKRKKRLNAFQKFMLRKGTTGGLKGGSSNKKDKAVDYHFQCSIIISIK